MLLSGQNYFVRSNFVRSMFGMDLNVILKISLLVILSKIL